MLTDETVTIGVEMNLPDVIRQICAYSDVSDPAEIAKILVDAIPPERHTEALALVMPVFVREHLGRQRTLTNPTQARNQLVRSARVTGIREWWRQVLEDRVAPHGVWKRLGDCTWEDLDWLAAQLRNKADSLIVKAQRLEKLRDQLNQYERGAKLSDLDPQTLRDLLGTLPDGRSAVPDPEEYGD